jgi:hypothetical protein
MKAGLFIMTCFLLLFGCQKEINFDLNSPLTTTDTSVILRVKKINYWNPGYDSSIYVYRNNLRNGIKGFYSFDTTSYPGGGKDNFKTEFKYNNNGNLTQIVQSGTDAAGTPFASVRDFSWSNNDISKIKWIENGSIIMNRNYDYETTHDSLIIRSEFYKTNLPGIWTDSASYILVADTGYNKAHTLLESGLHFFNGTQTGYYYQMNNEYNGSDITREKLFGERFLLSGPGPFNHRVDSCVVDYQRILTSNDFLRNMEEKILGKQLRILSHDKDSVSYIFDEFFDYYGNWTNSPSTTRFYFSNIQSSSMHSLNNAFMTFKVTDDGVIINQGNQKQIIKRVFSFDAQNRIQRIKEYYTYTGQLVTDIYFYY